MVSSHCILYHVTACIYIASMFPCIIFGISLVTVYRVMCESCVAYLTCVRNKDSQRNLPRRASTVHNNVCFVFTVFNKFNNRICSTFIT